MFSFSLDVFDVCNFRQILHYRLGKGNLEVSYKYSMNTKSRLLECKTYEKVAHFFRLEIYPMKVVWLTITIKDICAIPYKKDI